MRPTQPGPAGQGLPSVPGGLADRGPPSVPGGPAARDLPSLPEHQRLRRPLARLLNARLTASTSLHVVVVLPPFADDNLLDLIHLRKLALNDLVAGLQTAGVPGDPNFVIQTMLQNVVVVSDLAGPTGGIMLKSTTGATIIVNDTGIYIQNGKGASIVMTGPAVTINAGAMVIT